MQPFLIFILDTFLILNCSFLFINSPLIVHSYLLVASFLCFQSYANFILLFFPFVWYVKHVASDL
jgi:hypothetical protein